MKKTTESDLYDPVANYLRSLGYEVRGEVRSIDLVAIHDDELVAVELKLRMGLELILQAIERQRTADSVYVAVAARKTGPPLRNHRRVRSLLRRLELGLILVHFRQSGTRVEVKLHPSPYKPRSSKRERRNVIREFTSRTGDRNIGGSAAGRVITAYREQSVYIACALQKLGTASPSELQSVGTGDKTGSILYRNVYGWFDRIDRGRYGLHEDAKTAISEHPDLKDHYSRIVAKRLSDRPKERK